MSGDNLVFLEVLEWFDETGETLVHRIPAQGSGEIKYGAQLTVRENQAAIFFYQGRAVEAFGPGRHVLKTGNIPILTKIAALPWAMKSPLRAEVYFVNLKVFTNLKWGTRDPVAFKDSELGLIRLRAFGIFNIQIMQPLLFINSLVGTKGMYAASEIEEYLNRVIVSRFNDYIGKTLDSIVNLASKYDDLSLRLAKRLKQDFAGFGLGLVNLYINSITPPPEVQQAIDDRSRIGVFEDMNKLMQMKAAMAMEKAAESQGGSGDGMSTSLGLMMPAMFSRYFAGKSEKDNTKNQGEDGVACHECGRKIPMDARFCSYCGHQQVVFTKCLKCGKNLSPNAKFCSRCGVATDKEPESLICPGCGTKNLPQAIFCNECGEKLEKP